MKIFHLLYRYGGLIVLTIALTSVIGSLTIVLFLRATDALDRQLRETLRATAISAAFSIDGDDLADIRGPGDMLSPAYLKIAALLRNITAEIPQARFAYILRRTDNPSMLEFVVDADAGRSIDELDENDNGILDPNEEPSYPGEQYDISDAPALQSEAFLHSTTDPQVTVDQWGELLSGYAPIYSYSTNDVVAVIGIDMDAADFRAHTRSVLSPYAVLFIFVLAGLLAAGIGLYVESRQLQTLARMNAERSGLLQLTFHQLGEPITILQWAIETLDDVKNDTNELNKILPENLMDMREGVRRLGSIIDTLQEAEKVELGVFTNNPVEQSVKHFLEGVVSIVAPVGQSGTGRVSLDAPDTTFSFDPHLLTIVLRRLLENALEFSSARSLVHVRAFEEGKWLRIDIIDSGCGIPEEDVAHLFEKYRRASNATTMKPDGNGLGLYIAKGIVELMGGKIAARSELGHGSTFTVFLPFSRP